MEDITNTETAAAPEENQQQETLAARLTDAGLTKEEVSEALREVLQELKPQAPAVDVNAAMQEYFNSFIKKEE